MDKFVKEAIEEGIAADAVKGMVQRELEYKQTILTHVKWQRTAYKIMIALMVVILSLMSYILFTVDSTDKNLKDLITVMITAFTEMNRDTTIIK